MCTAGFTSLNGQEDLLISMGIRIFGPNASASQDLEPEYIAVSKNPRTAWVSVQENNAIADINLKTCPLVGIFPLGFKDHLLEGNALDASNRDRRGVRVLSGSLQRPVDTNPLPDNLFGHFGGMCYDG